MAFCLLPLSSSVPPQSIPRAHTATSFSTYHSPCSSLLCLRCLPILKTIRAACAGWLLSATALSGWLRFVGFLPGLDACEPPATFFLLFHCTRTPPLRVRHATRVPCRSMHHVPYRVPKRSTSPLAFTALPRFVSFALPSLPPPAGGRLVLANAFRWTTYLVVFMRAYAVPNQHALPWLRRYSFAVPPPAVRCWILPLPFTSFLIQCHISYYGRVGRVPHRVPLRRRIPSVPDMALDVGRPT